MSKIGFNEFQRVAGYFAVLMRHGPLGRAMYCGLGLTSEAGEVADIIKKWYYRGGDIKDEERERLKDELSDTLWYLQQTASEIDCTLEDIALHNIDKLVKRHGK